MATLREKHKLSIYKLNTSSFAPVVEELEERMYSPQQLTTDTVLGYQLKLFYQKVPSTPKWKGFIRAVAADDTLVCEVNKSAQENFVLLLENAAKLYAVTGGVGVFAIQKFLDETFGIDVFVRLVKKDERILKATKEKSLMGGVLGTTKHFRSNYNLFENDGFGKIYQELKATIDRRILRDDLGFSESDLKREAVCIAKSSFSIQKSVSFTQLLKVIAGLEAILARPPTIKINSARKLTKRRDSSLIANLEESLDEQLWERYSAPLQGFAFDLCAKDFEAYLTASAYVVKQGVSENSFFNEDFESLRNIDAIFEALRSIDVPPANKEEFTELLQSLKIYSYDSDGKEQTAGLLRTHLLGDVECGGRKCFFVDNNWYHIDSSFIDDLNESVGSYIRSNFHQGLTKSWDITQENEGQYNEKYLGEPDTIVLDRITPDNIEPCDVLRWDGEHLYLCHIKSSFGNSMRDLCSQVFIAANRIKQDLATTKEYINSIYSSLKAKIGGEPYFDRVGRQTERISLDEFIRLFEKKIVFVLGVLDVSETQNRDIRNVGQFRSNIAKFSIQELSMRMKGIDVPLKIAQILKP